MAGPHGLGLWLREFGYRPLLAETFCDIERTVGTCYKAANWTPLGITKGFTRVNRQECDFYVPNDRPKTLWVRPLDRDALKLLNSRELPEDCRRGATGNADGVMPLNTGARESLYEALRHVKDHRDRNRSFPIGGLLSIVVMAMMSGANSVKANQVGLLRNAKAVVSARHPAASKKNKSMDTGASRLG